MPKLPIIQLLWMAAIAVLLFGMFGQLTPGSEPIPYSRFQELLQQGQVARVTVSGDTIRGELKEKQANGSTHFVTHSVPSGLAGELAKHGVEYSGAPGTGMFGQVLAWVIPPLPRESKARRTRSFVLSTSRAGTT